MKDLKKLLDYEDEDLIDRDSLEILICKKIESNKDYARALLWIAKEFISRNKSYVEVKGLNKIIKKSRDSSRWILETLTSYNILKRIKSNDRFTSIKYILKDKELLIDLIEFCKKQLDILSDK